MDPYTLNTTVIGMVEVGFAAYTARGIILRVWRSYMLVCLYRIVSYRIVSYHILHHIIWYRIISYHKNTYHVTPYNII